MGDELDINDFEGLRQKCQSKQSSQKPHYYS